MKTLKISAIALILSTTAAFAQDNVQNVSAEMPETVAETSETVETATGPDLFGMFETICASAQANEVILSDEAMTACGSGAMPSVIASGQRFSKRGIGEELNTLIRNVAIFAN